MYYIHLHNIRMYARHGVHAEEAVIGNEFEVSLDVGFEPNEPIEQLNQTLNYATVYAIVEARFTHAQKLLETIAQHIISDIKDMDERIKHINITIMKKTAPIPNFTGKAGISINKSYP